MRARRHQPLGLITLALAVALVVSIVAVRYLVAPLAILTAFYVAFAASDRVRRARRGDGNERPDPAP